LSDRPSAPLERGEAPLFGRGFAVNPVSPRAARRKVTGRRHKGRIFNQPANHSKLTDSNDRTVYFFSFDSRLVAVLSTPLLPVSSAGHPPVLKSCRHSTTGPHVKHVTVRCASCLRRKDFPPLSRATCAVRRRRSGVDFAALSPARGSRPDLALNKYIISELRRKGQIDLRWPVRLRGTPEERHKSNSTE
jgi:hypothetical protein